MGLLDRIKVALNVVTGHGAKVHLTYGPLLVFPGEQVELGIHAASTGQPFRARGLFVDLSGAEVIDFIDPSGNRVRYHEQTFYREIQVAPAFALGAGERRQFKAVLEIPHEARPSFDGKLCRHHWQLRARVEVFGNDPHSEWVDTRVGMKQ